MLETFYHGLGSWRGENLLERLVEEVAQHDIAVMVEAAGHEASVCQHTYLFDQSLAEKTSLPLLSLLSFSLLSASCPSSLLSKLGHSNFLSNSK